jgi:hypothetical protein
MASYKALADKHISSSQISQAKSVQAEIDSRADLVAVAIAIVFLFWSLWSLVMFSVYRIVRITL